MSLYFKVETPAFDERTGLLRFQARDGAGATVSFGVTRKALLTLAGRLSTPDGELIELFADQRSVIHEAALRAHQRARLGKAGVYLIGTGDIMRNRRSK